MPKDPLVTVVIPTRGRHTLLLRAIKSALAQTYTHIEIVVVIDGPDEVTAAAVEELANPCVRYLALTENMGGAEARNIGVRGAAGEWIAFLDDDDEWHPKKIEEQLNAATEIPGPYVFVSCKFMERFDGHSEVYPFRLPDKGESISSYICVPRGVRTGGENLQTSTLLATRSLMLAVPFVKGLRRAQEFVWQIEAGARGCCHFGVVPDILSYLNSGSRTDKNRMSKKPDWRAFYACIKQRKNQFEPNAYAYTVCTRILTDALRCNEPFKVIFGLFKDVLQTGSATPRMIVLFLYLVIFSDDTRRKIGGLHRAVKGTPSRQEA